MAYPTCTSSTSCPVLPASTCIQPTPPPAAPPRLFRMHPKPYLQPSASSLVMFQLFPNADGGACVRNKDSGIPDTSTAFPLGYETAAPLGSGTGRESALGLCAGQGLSARRMMQLLRYKDEAKPSTPPRCLYSHKTHLNVSPQRSMMMERGICSPSLL